MNLKINRKMIKERCGIVSFKRGDAFYRANKVSFDYYDHNGYIAIVTGTEDFQVTIKERENGNIHAECSCPKLASFQKDCQHIAAVLIAILEQESGKDNASIVEVNPLELGLPQGITEEMMLLFNEKPVRTSGTQQHFENRQVLAATYLCTPVPIEKDNLIMGIEISIGSNKVENIRDFLANVKQGRSSFLSKTFTYNPELHCFQRETDEVIRQLIEVVHDENMYRKSLSDKVHVTISDQQLLIPPTSWEKLQKLLIQAPLVKLSYGGNKYEGLQLSDKRLPIYFLFEGTEDKGYSLKIKGMNQLIVLKSYRSVLYRGTITELKSDDCNRLFELNQMLEASGINHIPIQRTQVDFFMEKVVPGLKRLGNVQINESITKQYLKTPLIAKLYLDRVKNRLLAGLEFHYEHIIVDPLDDREIQTTALFIRDHTKEAAILKLMEDSSFAKTEGGYFLHNEELEYEFLTHMLPQLQNLVQIFATTAVRNRIFRENTPPRIHVKMKKDRTNWLEFKFEMDGVSEKEIRELLFALEEKRKYYRLRNGSLLSLETREFQEIHRFLNAVPIQNEELENEWNVPIVRGLQLFDSLDSKLLTIEDSFRNFLESLQNPEHLDFAVPDCLQSKLRDYQKNGFKWMKLLSSYGFGGILADSMGLGKTIQSITFILSELPVIREKKQPALIVCPSSLTYNWLNEMMKFVPDLQAVVIDGTKTERIQLQRDVLEMDVVITSYPLVRRDIKWVEKQIFHTVFFDEAQAFKNPITQTARAVKRIKANHRFALTGTPIENSIEDLWSIFHVVFPELFLGLKEYSHLTRKTIARRASPFLLRRKKEDVLSELPEKIESIASADLLPEQKQLYAAYLAKLRHETLKHLDKDTLRKNKIRILAGLTRLRQICCHPGLFVHGYTGNSAKLNQLIQIIEESKLSGRRVLIFSQFTKMLALIGNELARRDLPFFYLDGQTPSEERVKICERFNEGERNFFLISLKAGGTGLNLTGADTVILYDIWWNPAVEEQAADRAHRIGQTNSVQVIKLVARGTIEEKMNELQDKKKNIIDEVIESKQGSASLTDEDIREILNI
ncbi:SNF2 family DNA or RNA helicase [Cytobacillus eiseniae]|uniref:SNF2 family DNA or RNA helicase n=1 Tax=Cytobacillus eiseniae TaxID=762947 RepID=A0ABS4R9E1_9BACI|nr:DEAD/DEAH box helicase [Cytobacillus eiseniae]MBP2239515.1 SNF2 family DNA or RNA helicase [Cytobacillus eiseniae]